MPGEGQNGVLDENADGHADGQVGGGLDCRAISTSAEKAKNLSRIDPGVTIYVEPFAFPSILGLAGFSGSTWIGAMYIAGWWRDVHSPKTWGLFTALFGGFGQFIAAFFGFHTRDAMVTVVHALWGSFWIAVGIFGALEATALPDRQLDVHFPALASWFVVLAFITWICALSVSARDLMYSIVLVFLASGATISCCLFSFGDDVTRGIKAAAYAWLVSAGLGWLRVTIGLMEEAYGDKAPWLFEMSKVYKDKLSPPVNPGFGEPGVTSAKMGKKYYKGRC